MDLIQTEQLFLPIEVFITRFLLADELIFEQETTFPLPSIGIEDLVEIDDFVYMVKQRFFSFSEDAFILTYFLKGVQPPGRALQNEYNICKVEPSAV
ncbi:hypothetical protein [Paenibacillus sp. GP183]|uniref:hypothetical protein n=1 Tax=Paenibacillus sp. GP183 TaxID=1882751 RepID=UPI00089C110E|nr:hypothetical protein [Paenibacillus sp. GP183]SEB57844.1 hypothetical protein SAMN05443246_1165 [Paenibacillus sp. GP183]